MAAIPGLSVLAVMAAIWACMGLLLWQAAPAALAAPVIVSALIYLASRRPARNLVPRTAAEEERIGRLVGFWSLAEGIAIAPVAFILANTGLGRLIPAAIAIIVGLHFLPLARGTPRPLNYATGAGMIAAGLAGLRVLDAGAVALICAGVLWATCLVMILQAATLPRRAAA